MLAKTILLGGSALAAAILAAPAAAQDAPQGQNQNQTTEQRLKALEDREAAREADEKASATKLSALEKQLGDTVWTFTNSRPTVQTTDGRFLMSLRYRLQFDTALFDQNRTIPNAQYKDLASGAVVRRFYIGAEGRAFREFWYELRLDFGGANVEATNAIVNLARISYNVGNVANPKEWHFRINAGIIQPIFTYGDSPSSGSTTFLERADSVNVATGAYGGTDPRRGLEFTFQQSDLIYGGDNLVLSTALTGQQPQGISNSGGIAVSNTTDEGDQIVGRVAYRVWSDGTSNAQVGASFSHILNLTGATSPGGVRTMQLRDRPEVRVDGNRLVDTGAIPATGGDMWGLEGGGNWRNFFLYGEYMKFMVDRNIVCGASCPVAASPSFTGWYAEASYILTGETKTYQPIATNNEMATFNNPKIVTPFAPESGHWGGFELALRYSDLDLNWHPGTLGQLVSTAPIGGIRGGEEKIWTFGLNWYFNNNVLMRFNYLLVDVNKLGSVGSPATLQQVGQKFNAFAVRLQFSN